MTLLILHDVLVEKNQGRLMYLEDHLRCDSTGYLEGLDVKLTSDGENVCSLSYH